MSPNLENATRENAQQESPDGKPDHPNAAREPQKAARESQQEPESHDQAGNLDPPVADTEDEWAGATGQSHTDGSKEDDFDAGSQGTQEPDQGSQNTLASAGQGDNDGT